MEAEQLSQEMKFEVKSSAFINELLLQCPPNEHSQVLHDLEIINKQELDGSLANIHNNNIAIVELVRQVELTEGDESIEETETTVDVNVDKILISPYNHVKDDLWYEPHSGTVFKVDLKSLQAVSTDGAMHQKLVEKDLHDALMAYAKRTLHASSSAVGAYCLDKPESNAGEEAEVNNGIAIVLVGSRIEPKNMWSGQWKSEWSIKGTRLLGNLTAIVHYFEEGNIQLKASNTIDLTLDSTGTEAVISKIEESENAFQLSLNEAYQKLNQNAFKRLRRQLPITRTKMDWSKIGAYGLGTELRSVRH